MLSSTWVRAPLWMGRYHANINQNALLCRTAGSERAFTKRPRSRLRLNLQAPRAPPHDVFFYNCLDLILTRRPSPHPLASLHFTYLLIPPCISMLLRSRAVSLFPFLSELTQSLYGPVAWLRSVVEAFQRGWLFYSTRYTYIIPTILHLSQSRTNTRLV